MVIALPDLNIQGKEKKDIEKKDIHPSDKPTIPKDGPSSDESDDFKEWWKEQFSSKSSN